VAGGLRDAADRLHRRGSLRLLFDRERARGETDQRGVAFRRDAEAGPDEAGIGGPLCQTSWKRHGGSAAGVAQLRQEMATIDAATSPSSWAAVMGHLATHRCAAADTGRTVAPTPRTRRDTCCTGFSRARPARRVVRTADEQHDEILPRRHPKHIAAMFGWSNGDSPDDQDETAARIVALATKLAAAHCGTCQAPRRRLTTTCATSRFL